MKKCNQCNKKIRDFELSVKYKGIKHIFCSEWCSDDFYRESKRVK